MSQPHQADVQEQPDKFQQIQHVLNDVVHRRNAGEMVSDESIQRLRPDLMPELARELGKLRMIEAARQAAEQPPEDSSGDQGISSESDLETQGMPEADELNARAGMLRICCPHCQNPIAIVADDATKDITCRLCGSTFNLVHSDQKTRSTTPVRTVGHFRLVEPLGRGAFGTVWKALDTTLDRTVAVKIPRKGELEKEELELFLREARAAAQLKHPNIVTVHEVGRDGEDIFIVSDIIRGATLADMLTAKRYSFRESAELCKKIAAALHHAHEANVVHRDLKPSNIMIDPDGEPHIMDFGLAKREAGEITMTADGRILGTPAYMSPEQAKGKSHEADRRSDVFSLGVILYKLLTNELPFRGNEAAVLKQIQDDDPVRPRKLNARIPRDLETICLKCLEKKPIERYQTANDLAKDLACFLDGDAITARPINRLQQGWRWAKRNPTVAILSSALGLALLLLALGASAFAVFQTLQRLELKNRMAEILTLEQKWRTSATEAEQEKKTADEQRTLAEKRLYFARILLTRSHRDQGLVDRTKELLHLCQQAASETNDLGWEWRLLSNLCSQDLITLKAHEGAVRAIDCSPNGPYIASAGVDHLIRLWNQDTGVMITTLEKHTGAVNDVSYSPAGDTLCSAGQDGRVCVWDLSTTVLLAEYRGHSSPVHTARWNPEGTLLASGGADSQVHIWNVSTPTKTLERLEVPHPVNSIVWSPDGQCLIAAHGHTNESPRHDFTIWDVKTWKPIATREFSLDNPIRSCSWHHSGNLIAMTSGYAQLRIYDSEQWRVLATHRDVGPVRSLAWNNDKEYQRLAFAGDGQLVHIYDFSRKRPIASLWGHSGRINSIKWTADDRHIVSAGEDGTIRIWDSSSMDEASVSLVLDNYVSSVSWSPDNSRLGVAFLFPTALLIDRQDTNRRVVLSGHTNRIWSIAWHPHKNVVATASRDGTVRLWNASTGELLKTHQTSAFLIKWSPDGDRFLTAHTDEINVWEIDMDSLSISKLSSHSGPGFWGLAHVDWHPNGTRIASPITLENSEVGVDIWDPESGRSLTVFETGTVTRALSWHPDGNHLAIGDATGFLTVIDLPKKSCVLRVRAHDNIISSVSWSIDGDRLASCAWDGTVKVRDGQTGEELLVFRDEADRFEAMAWSPNGQSLAAGTWSEDRNVLKIWEASSDALLKRFEDGDTSGAEQGEIPWTLFSMPLDDLNMGSCTTVGDRRLSFDDLGGDSLVILVVRRNTDTAETMLALDELRRRYRILREFGVGVAVFCATETVSLVDDYAKKWDLSWIVAVSGEDFFAADEPGHLERIWKIRYVLVDRSSSTATISTSWYQIERCVLLGSGDISEMATKWAIAGEWDLVGEFLSLEMAAGRGSIDWWTSLGVAQLLAGNREGYEETCDAAVLHFSGSNSHSLLYRVIRLCLLADRQLGSVEPIGGMVESLPGGVDPNNIDLARGMWAFRNGLWEESIERLPKNGDCLQVPLSSFYRAIANHHLGRQAEASRLYREACMEMGMRMPSPDGEELADYLPPRWVVWGMLELARREARSLLSYGMSETELEFLDSVASGRSEVWNGSQLGVDGWTKLLVVWPSDPILLRNRGLAFVGQGKWKEAADDFKTILRSDPSDVGDWLRAAVVLACSGEDKEFRQHCREMIDQFEGCADLRAQSITAKVCLLMPDAFPITEIPLSSLERSLEEGTSSETRQAWDGTTLAMAAYRKGDARSTLEYVLQVTQSPMYNQNIHLRMLTVSLKALGQVASGETEAAKETLAQASEMVREGLSRMVEGSETSWHDVLVAHILCQEAAMRIERVVND